MVAVPAELGAQQAMDEWIGSLRNYLSRKLPLPEDAEDLAQEACIRFLQAHQNDKEIRNPRAYLFQIASHLLYHHYASQVRRPGNCDVDIDLIAATDEGVEELASSAIPRQLINQAVSELPLKYQQALRLRWIVGLRIAEIADEMDLSVGMVKKYLATGLSHCRKRLNRYGADAVRVYFQSHSEPSPSPTVFDIV